jgi:hypothetical protein
MEPYSTVATQTHPAEIQSSASSNIALTRFNEDIAVVVV